MFCPSFCCHCLSWCCCPSCWHPWGCWCHGCFLGCFKGWGIQKQEVCSVWCIWPNHLCLSCYRSSSPLLVLLRASVQTSHSQCTGYFFDATLSCRCHQIFAPKLISPLLLLLLLQFITLPAPYFEEKEGSFTYAGRMTNPRLLFMWKMGPEEDVVLFHLNSI
jgi:hypothetical protein